LGFAGFCFLARVDVPLSETYYFRSILRDLVPIEHSFSTLHINSPSRQHAVSVSLPVSDIETTQPEPEAEMPNSELQPESTSNIESDASAPEAMPEPEATSMPEAATMMDAYISEDPEDDDDDDDDDDTGHMESYVSPDDDDSESMMDSYVMEPEPEPEPEPIVELTFNLKDSEIPSFKFLQDAREEIFVNRRTFESFEKEVATLEEAGDEGRRRGLGAWMVADYEGACTLLASHESDDVASFTHANALMSLGRPADAEPIFKRLAEKYPGEHKPLAGYFGARFEAALPEAENETADKALDQLDADLSGAVEGFAESAEGHYLLGRAAEERRNLQEAVDHYFAARELAPHMRANLFRLAFVCERTGLDDVALNCYQTLSKARPIERKILMNLGLLLEDMGRDQEAAACYDTVNRHDPTDPKARMFLSHARSGMSMYYDEDLERKEDRLNQILRIPITDFELSVRARNCLNKMNIMSLGDLVRKTEQELLSYKNFGETSLNEIKEILGSKGLRLGMAREEAVLSIEQSVRRYTSGNNVEAMNRPIADLELSIRARRTVEALGCLTVGDVIQHSEDELLGMPNFGVTSLVELREKLTEFSLTLKSSN
jgi:DNA-directed RNA polymerase subunit alpha